MSGIDTISITPDPEHLIYGKVTKEENVTYRSALRVSSDSGPSPCIPKWSDGGNHRVPRHERVESTRGVSFRPIVRGAFPPPPPPPHKVLF